MTLQERNLVALPLKPQNCRSALIAHLIILRRFEFRSQLLRSGVIAKDPDHRKSYFFVRGAPGAIEQLVGADIVPASYRQVCQADSLITDLTDSLCSLISLLQRVQTFGHTQTWTSEQQQHTLVP